MAKQSTKPSIFDDQRRFPRQMPPALRVAYVVQTVMDNAIRIPFTNRRIGLDSLVGLFPVSGDLITGTVSLYMIILATHYELPMPIIRQMAVNIVIDIFAGMLPILGDVFDVFYKANARNYKLLMDYLETYRQDLFIPGKSYVPPTYQAGNPVRHPAEVIIDVPRDEAAKQAGEKSTSEGARP